MTGRSEPLADAESAILKRWDGIIRHRIRALVSDAVIEEYRRDRAGPHSDALSRILNYFRRASIRRKYALYTVEPFRRYRILSLSGIRGVPPAFLNDIEYTSRDEADFAVFTLRIRDLMEGDAK